MTPPGPFDSIVALWPTQSMSDTRDLRHRYRGALLGVAVGDALGLPVEGWPASLQRSFFPDGVREIGEEEKGLPWDDDVAQTAMLAEAVLASPSLTLDDLAQRLLHWRETNGRGMGTLTAAVLGALLKGHPADNAAKHVWELLDRDPAGNGAVMRCSPVALRYHADPGKLTQEALTSAAVSHHDPRCGWSAVAVCIAIAFSLNDWPLSLNDLARAMAHAGAPDEAVKAVFEANGADLEYLSLDDETMGYTLKAMQVGLWACTSDLGFEDGLVHVVSAGGDTDTNGAVAGAVLGAKYGSASIPQRWLDRITEPERLVELADDLFDQANL